MTGIEPAADWYAERNAMRAAGRLSWSCWQMGHTTCSGPKPSFPRAGGALYTHCECPCHLASVGDDSLNPNPEAVSAPYPQSAEASPASVAGGA